MLYCIDVNIRLINIIIVRIGINITINITYDDFDDLMKFLEMLLQMDCCVRVLYGGSVRREDGIFEDMEEELEWFDEPHRYNCPMSPTSIGSSSCYV